MWLAGSRAQAQYLWRMGLVAPCSMWDLPGPGLEPVSPALADGFVTTVPPGKPCSWTFDDWLWCIFVWMSFNLSFLVNFGLPESNDWCFSSVLENFQLKFSSNSYTCFILPLFFPFQNSIQAHRTSHSIFLSLNLLYFLTLVFPNCILYNVFTKYFPIHYFSPLFQIW